MTSLDDFAARKLAQLGSASLRRTLRTVDTGAGHRVRAGGLNFCSNDYLGLANDPRLAEAARAAAEEFGVGAGASRLVTGNHSLYDMLERKIAAVKDTEAAVVFGSGYLANLGAIPALVGEGDLVLTDALSHACMMSGAKLSGAKVVTFRHNDVDDLHALLAAHRASARHCLVLTEGVFSMDGDLAPLPDIVAVARDHDAWTMTDDAHGLGVVGDGFGSAAHWGVAVDVQMGTLSKAVGSYGGYVAASQPVVDLLINRARSFVYATGLPPTVVAASIAGIDIIAGDPALCAVPLARARLFAAQLNLAVPQSPIVPLIVGASDAALAASRALEESGFLVTAIRPPTVPDGTARLRVTFTAAHSEDDVLRLVVAVRSVVPLNGLAR
ncbi:MAG: 8-amino-7-oxononanoate synthase [Alphaproteobacteria bacterium]|nr:8-amino-7-oxononanoate synthase [Alphaproteobacteria bacterium]